MRRKKEWKYKERQEEMLLIKIEIEETEEINDKKNRTL